MFLEEYEEYMETVALILAIILFGAGLLGTILPVLPGAILIYAGFILYGIMTGFRALNATFFLLQGLVLIIVFLVDFVSSAAGTKVFKGSKQSAFGAAAGTIAGLIALGPLGIIVGPFLGAVVVELLVNKDIRQAVNVGFGTVIGVLGGTIAKLIIEAIMIIYFFTTIW